MPKFGTKNSIFGYFLGLIFKNLYSYLKSFVKNEFLTDTVNYSMGSAFSKDPVSAFSEGLGLGPSLLFKVCPNLIYENKLNIELQLLNIVMRYLNKLQVVELVIKLYSTIIFNSKGDLYCV